MMLCVGPALIVAGPQTLDAPYPAERAIPRSTYASYPPLLAPRPIHGLRDQSLPNGVVILHHGMWRTPIAANL